MPKLKPFSTNLRSTARHKYLLVIAAGLLLAMASSSPANSISECEFIIRTMNKLGARMSLLRLTIASTDDKETRDLASQQLEQGLTVEHALTAHEFGAVPFALNQLIAIPPLA